ncbi:MAG: ribbon-helix-helix domain-containing protein [bacterium]
MTDLTNRMKRTYTFDKKLISRLDQLKEETRVPKSRLLDEALEDLFKKYENRKEK